MDGAAAAIFMLSITALLVAACVLGVRRLLSNDAEVQASRFGWWKYLLYFPAFIAGTVLIRLLRESFF